MSCGRYCSDCFPSSLLSLILLVALFSVYFLVPLHICVHVHPSQGWKNVILTVIFILIGLNIVWVGLRCCIEEPSYLTSAISFEMLFCGAELWRFSEKHRHSLPNLFLLKFALFFYSDGNILSTLHFQLILTTASLVCFCYNFSVLSAPSYFCSAKLSRVLKLWTLAFFKRVYAFN